MKHKQDMHTYRLSRADCIYLALLALGILMNAIFKIDSDSGGYIDTLWSVDKITHFVFAYAIVLTGLMIRVKKPIALGGIIVASIAFEFTQGFVSVLDIFADCVGAIIAMFFYKKMK
mgnify:CR=1 FL=1